MYAFPRITKGSLQDPHARLPEDPASVAPIGADPGEGGDQVHGWNGGREGGEEGTERPQRQRNVKRSSGRQP